MSENYSIKWLGFNEASNYNSVWGHLLMHDNRDYVFWGIRGKTMLFKRHGDFNAYKIPYLIAQREKKGYKKIHPAHFEMLCPNFMEDLEIWLMAHILSED